MPHIQIADAVLDVHDAGSGPPLVLVHGFPLDRGMWRHQLEGLKGTARVIAPDLRGFGNSTVTPGKVTMAQFADDIAAMLSAMKIEEPVLFCGLSMGGYVAWQFFKRHRKRLRGLVLCDTRAIADTPQAAGGRLELADRVEREGPAFVADAMLPKLLAAATFEQKPEIVHELRETILRMPPQGIAAAARGMAEREAATPWLADVDVPTLVLCGEQDAIATVKEMSTIASAIRDAEMVVIPHAGHMPPVEEPEATNRALQAYLERIS